jgi:hypothetical protein
MLRLFYYSLQRRAARALVVIAAAASARTRKLPAAPWCACISSAGSSRLAPCLKRWRTIPCPARCAGSVRLKNYFRDHATPLECLPLPHSPTLRQPIRRIARPRTPQLSSRFDSRATHAPTHLPAAFAFAPSEFVLVQVRARVLNSLD